MINPTGKCLCGCGESTSIYKRTWLKHGIIKGEHARFIHGHAIRVNKDRVCNEAWKKAHTEGKIGNKNPNWKGDSIAEHSGRFRAQRAFKELGMCSRCSKKKATDRHHKDGDTRNNNPSNIAFLCRRCHMVEDGRMVNLVVRNKRSVKEEYANT